MRSEAAARRPPLPSRRDEAHPAKLHAVQAAVGGETHGLGGGEGSAGAAPGRAVAFALLGGVRSRFCHSVVRTRAAVYVCWGSVLVWGEHAHTYLFTTLHYHFRTHMNMLQAIVLSLTRLFETAAREPGRRA